MKTQGLYKGELFSTDISVSVAQIKKNKKTRCIYFQIWLLGGPSPPSQLVPNPFNWSPIHSTGPQTPFFTDISASVAQIIFFFNLHFFSNFGSGSGSRIPYLSTIDNSRTDNIPFLYRFFVFLNESFPYKPCF